MPEQLSEGRENDVGIKGAMVVEWDEPSCIIVACASRRAVRARSPWRTARSPSSQTNATTAVDAQRHVLQMHGRARQDTLSHSEDYLKPRSTAARSFAVVGHPEEQLFRITDAAIQFFADNAKPSERFQIHIGACRLEDKFKALKEAYNG